jgi:hypothetical protein
MNNKKVNEITVELTGDELNKQRGHLKPTDTVRIVDKGASSSSMSSKMEENEMVSPEAFIEPQDKATIKYLSNVKDENTGEVSAPFAIGNNKYQMIRGIHPSGEVGLAVFCHDETDEAGENIIYPMDYFEENIAKPMMEKETMIQHEDMFGGNIEEKIKLESKGMDSLNLSEFKHYLVNEKTGKFRKFKNIVELAVAVMSEDEKYMTIKEFRKFFENRVFGGKKESKISLVEVTPTGEENDEEMNAKAKKLMVLISKRIPTNIIQTIKTPVAKREVIAAFAELIGVPRQGLPNLINGLKVLSKTKDVEPAAPITEKKVITKAELTESLSKPKVIKVVKVKDIK